MRRQWADSQARFEFSCSNYYSTCLKNCSDMPLRHIVGMTCNFNVVHHRYIICMR